MMSQPIIIDDEKFDRMFQPETDEEGNLYVIRDWDTDREWLSSAMDENRVWTMVETDIGSLALLSGNHIVNRLFNVVTKIPWKKEYEVHGY
jgi:hypothetical protein